MTTAYPLAWPQGWPRTKGDRVDSRYRFRSAPRFASSYASQPVTFEVARKKLCDELDRLGATNVIISTNLPLRADGMPLASAAGRRIEDPGVAVYFTLNKRAMVMACDRYDAPSANMRSVGLAIEALRQLARHGGGSMMERAFSGFAALPAPDARKPWREVFGYAANIRPDERTLAANFRALAKVRHPDNGGHHTLMAELNIAFEDARKELGL
jgi:hypothetical protein